MGREIGVIVVFTIEIATSVSNGIGSSNQVERNSLIIAPRIEKMHIQNFVTFNNYENGRWTAGRGVGHRRLHPRKPPFRPLKVERLLWALKRPSPPRIHRRKEVIGFLLPGSGLSSLAGACPKLPVNPVKIGHSAFVICEVSSDLTWHIPSIDVLVL